QVRHRLHESRRMRLAMLEVWPDEPHMEVVFSWGPDKPQYSAVQRFLLGMRHEEEHVAQVAEIVRQAKARRSELVLA
ncbi:MAG: DinB family protein, partial [Caldilineaceae bacterium]